MKRLEVVGGQGRFVSEALGCEGKGGSRVHERLVGGNEIKWRRNGDKGS